MLRAACTTFFLGFLRSGEVTTPKNQFDEGAHLAFGDVTLYSRSSPNLVKSKTDPFRQGISIFLGVANNHLCPTIAMAAYLASQGDTLGPFFQFKSRELAWRVSGRSSKLV